MQLQNEAKRGEQMKRTNLLEARKCACKTQQEIAEASGIQRSYYGLIETGKRNPTLKIAKRIAPALDTDIERVFPDEIFFANRCYDSKL